MKPAPHTKRGTDAVSKICSSPECQTPSRVRGLCRKHYEQLRGRAHGKRAPIQPITLLDRFEAKFIPEPNSGCWIWLGSINNAGRATVFTAGRRHQAARIAFSLYRDEITSGLCVCHRCDTPLCVNPNHLWLGTHKDNMEDMVAKGRTTKGKYFRRPQPSQAS